MKYIVKLLLVIALPALVACCTDDDGKNPEFGPDEVYIYDSRSSSLAVTKDEENLIDMIVSPADGSVDCRWLLDGRVISNQKDLEYTFDTAGSFTLRFEASRGKRTAAKVFQLSVNN